MTHWKPNTFTMAERGLRLSIIQWEELTGASYH